MPDNFVIKENTTARDDLIFIANNKKGSNAYSIGVAVSVEKTSASELDILNLPSNFMETGGFKVVKDSKIIKDKRQ